MGESKIFSGDIVSELAEMYGFKDANNLADKLNAAAFFWETYDSGKKLKQTETVNLLKKIIKHSSGLREKIIPPGFDISEMHLLFKQGCFSVDNSDLGGEKGFEWEKFKSDLDEVARSAKSALSFITEDKLSCKDFAILDLLTTLRAIYVEGTGKVDKYSDDGECSGQFFNFTQQCLKNIGVRFMSNRSLCKKLKETI